MKVLMVVALLNVGGTEMYILSLAESLKRLGVQVGIATQDGTLVQKAKKMGISVHTVPVLQSPQKAASQLQKIVKTGGYTIIHAHDDASYRCMYHYKGPIPIVLTIHGTYHKSALLLAAKKSHKIVAVSPRLKSWTIQRGIPANKLHIIPNAVNTLTFTPVSNQIKWRKQLALPPEKLLICYAARFSKDKQIIVKRVIQAFTKVALKNTNVALVVAGPGRFRDEVIKLANRKNQILKRYAIKVLPPLLNINRLYQASDIVIGTGRVALEAMACGKPVITAGKLGTVGIVTPNTIERAVQLHFGDHGFVSQLTIEQLEQNMNRLINHSKLRKRLGAFGVKIVKTRFSPLSNARKLLRVYQK